MYFYGETLLALNKYRDSELAFQHALVLRQDLGLEQAILSPKLGLVHVAQKRGKVEQALRELDEILSLFDSPQMDHLDDPFGFYWNCFKLLNENQDTRARKVLEKAYYQLKERAATIPEESSRHSFLYNVPEHRNIIETFETA